MNKGIILSVIIITMSVGVARGQETLTWAMCIKEAAEKNPDIAVAKAGVDSAEAQYSGAFSNFMPQISGSGSYTLSNSTVVQNGFAAPVSSEQGTYTAGLTGTQNIFNGFHDAANVKVQKAQLEAAKAALALAKATLSSNLKSAFAQLLFQQESVELALAILKREQTDLRLVETHFEGGQENKGNLLYQEATVAQAQYQYDHSVRQVRVAIKQLAAFLGRPDTDDIAVVGNLIAKDVPASTNMRALALIHPGHIQAYYNQIAADANVDQQASGWFPTVNANGFLGKSGPDFFPQNSRWSVGVTINVPLFQGTSTIFSVQNAKALEMQAEYTVSSTDNKLIAALELAFGGLKDAIGQEKANDLFEKAAKARSVISTEKYNTGLMTFEDWAVIESDLVTRQQNHLQSELSAKQAEASWELAAGIGDIP